MFPTPFRALVPLALTGALVAAAGAQAATITLNTTADTYVRSDAKGSNYGTRTELRAEDLSPEVRALVRFDARGITRPVTKAVLRVRAVASATSGFTVRTLTGTAGAWKETAV